MNSRHKEYDFVSFIFYRTILILTAAVLLWFLLMGLTRQYILSELFEAIGNTGYELFLVFAVSCLLVFFLIIRKWIEKQSQRRLKIIRRIVLAISLIMYLSMYFSFRVMPITDSWALIDQARYLASHSGAIIDRHSVYFGYFSRYGNNSLLCLLFLGLFKLLDRLGIGNFWAVIYFINAGMLLLGNYFAYAALKKCKGEKAATWGLVLLAINPLSYLFVFWYYSATVSVPLMTGIIYYGVKLYKEKTDKLRVIYAVVMGLMIALAFEIRPTSVIPFIAFLLMTGISFFVIRTGRVRRLAYIGVILVIAFLVMKICDRACQPYFKETKEHNFPVSHWLMMGAHGLGIYNKEDVRYTKSFEGKRVKTYHTLKRMIEHYKKNGFVGTVHLWARKSANTFTDGWSDAQDRMANDTIFSPAYQLIAGSRKEAFYLLAQAMRCVLFFFMLSAICQRIKIIRDKSFDPFFVMTVLTFLGGVAFYCLWEVKSVYSLPFVPVMIMVGSQCRTEGILRRISRKNEVLEKNRIKNIEFYAIAILLWLIIFSFYFKPFCKMNYRHLDFNIRSSTLEKTSRVKGLNDKGAFLEQDIYARKAFNTVDLYALISSKSNEKRKLHKEKKVTEDGQGRLEDRGEDTGYRLVIEDCAGDSLIDMKISMKIYDRISRRFRLSLPKRIDEGEYILKIINDTGNNPVRFIHRKSMACDTYQGACRVNGEVQTYDLFLSVLDIRRYPYCGKKVYTGFMLMVFVVAWVEWIMLRRIKEGVR